MFSTEEIIDDYYSDLERKTNIVRNRQGIEVFLPQNVVKGFDGYRTFDVYGGLHIDEIVCSEFKPRENLAPKKRVVQFHNQ